MKAVAVKALKNNLSRYLRAVQEGETVWVTDRDEVIAEIHRPCTAVFNRVSRWESFLNQEERRGYLRRAKPSGLSLQKLWDLPRPEVKIEIQTLLDAVKAD